MSISFVLTILLYVVPPVLQVILTGTIRAGFDTNLSSYLEYFPLALFFCSLFFVVFALTFRYSLVAFGRKIHLRCEVIKKPSVLYWLICIMFFMLSLYMVGQLASSIGGIKSLVLAGYGVTELFNTSSAAVAGIPWLLTTSLLFLVGAKNSKHGMLEVAAMLLVAVLVISLIAMGRRGQLTGFGLALLIVYHFSYKMFSLKKFFVILLSGFILLNIVGLVRGASYSSVSDLFNKTINKTSDLSNDGKMNIFYTLESGNFVLPFQSLPNIIAHTGVDVELQFFNTFISGVALVIPQALWSDRPTPLSNWYMREFIDANALSNQGVQFFFLSEAYLDFGAFGILIWGMGYGILFAALCALFCRRLGSPVHLVILALFVGNYLNFVSADTFGGFVVFMKSVIAPCLVILFFSYTLKKSKFREMHE